MSKERFVVPLSHDEVANMKGSMIEKMGKKDLELGGEGLKIA